MLKEKLMPTVWPSYLWSYGLIVMLVPALMADAQDIVVGFERDSYDVSEGGSVTICVEIISPDDIGGNQLHLQVEAIENIGQATPDEDDPIFGDYLMNPGADYPPPCIGRVDLFEIRVHVQPPPKGQIRNMPLTQSRRSVCYEQRAYQDDEEESDEFFSLRVVVDNTVDPSLLVPNLVIDESRGTTQVRIVGDTGCPKLMDIPNGAVNETGFTTGDVAVYSCVVGYLNEGDPTRTCGSDLEWTGSAPSCIPVECPSLERPNDGTLSQTGKLYEDKAMYSCNPGFSLRGKGTLNCQADGTWDSIPPTCIKSLKFTFNPVTYTVTEGVNEFVELVLQTEDSSSNNVFILNVSFVPQSAKAGSDFDATPQVEALAPGQREERVRVLIIDDSTAEETEIFTAILSTGDMDTPAVATVIILDNDSDDNGSSNTTIIVIIVTGVIAALLIAIVITAIAIGIMRQKKKKFALPTPDPIYDDPDNPYYSSVLDKTEKAASNEISLQTQPEGSKYVTLTNQQKNVAPSIEQQDNVAYGAVSNQHQQLPGDQAEEQC